MNKNQMLGYDLVVHFFRIRLLKIIWKNTFVANEFMFQDMDNEKEKDLNVFLLQPRDMSVEYKITKM